ncbi:MAG: phage tail tube protein, partial [Planctomycetota bacterium]
MPPPNAPAAAFATGGAPTTRLVEGEEARGGRMRPAARSMVRRVGGCMAGPLTTGAWLAALCGTPRQGAKVRARSCCGGAWRRASCPGACSPWHEKSR